MAVEMQDDTLKAATEAVKVLRERAEKSGQKLQKDFRGDEAFQRDDPVEQFASLMKSLGNTFGALERAVDAAVAERDELRKQNEDLKKTSEADGKASADLIERLLTQRDVLAKGGKVHGLCKMTGKIEEKAGEKKDCGPCKGLGVLSAKS